MRIIKNYKGEDIDVKELLLSLECLNPNKRTYRNQIDELKKYLKAESTEIMIDMYNFYKEIMKIESNLGIIYLNMCKYLIELDMFNDYKCNGSYTINKIKELKEIKRQLSELKGLEEIYKLKTTEVLNSDCKEDENKIMTDKDIFEKVMNWLGMKVNKEKEKDGNLIRTYEDSAKCDKRFTKVGYDEFYAGAIFDKKGKIIKAYVDSHVGPQSYNSEVIGEMIDN